MGGSGLAVHLTSAEYKYPQGLARNALIRASCPATSPYPTVGGKLLGRSPEVFPSPSRSIPAATDIGGPLTAWNAPLNWTLPGSIALVQVKLRLLGVCVGLYP